MIMIVKNNIIFMGPPGVGKGTAAAIVSEKTQMVHVSTGSIFREEINKNSELGQKVKELVQGGNYVPDEITNQIVKNKINELREQNKKMILDGYPRTIKQAEFLDSISQDDKFVVVELFAPQEVILERLSGRRTCSICGTGFHIKFKPSSVENKCDNCDGELIQRKDDQPEAIIKRFEVYKTQTEPLLNYYKESQRLIQVDATETPEKIAEKNLFLIK
ncbi:adenylate kinase [Mycoplasmopsis pullorum]|nr:adenylate kinase [Mycoplasmopsis pullorum]